MPEDFPYGNLVIIALIAVFILLQLRRVLGSKTGLDNPGFFNKQAQASERDEPVVQVNEKSLKAKPVAEDSDPYLAQLTDLALANMLNQIKAKDAQFNATHFLNGAKMAFEMAFDAFGKGDKETLQKLLSAPLYQHFSEDIDARAAQENKPEATLVTVESKEINDVRLDKNMARISVQFTSGQIAIVRGPRGEIVQGDPSRVDKVLDEWVFERDVTAKNPNWKIIET